MNGRFFMLSPSSSQPHFTHKLSTQSKRALTHLRLEGIAPSSDLLADMELFDAGKITEDQFIKRGIARAKNTEK